MEQDPEEEAGRLLDDLIGCADSHKAPPPPPVDANPLPAPVDGDDDVPTVSLERLRSGDVDVACPGCGRLFRRSQLAIHMRTRACAEHKAQLVTLVGSRGSVPAGRVKCPQCAHVSPNLKALRKHFASHHGETRFLCIHCDKSYGRSDALRKHQKTCGVEADRSLACVCKPTSLYKTLYNLQHHIKREAAKAAADGGDGVLHARVTAPPGGGCRAAGVDPAAHHATYIMPSGMEPPEVEEDVLGEGARM
jgi:hypothetical protein